MKCLCGQCNTDDIVASAHETLIKCSVYELLLYLNHQTIRPSHINWIYNKCQSNGKNNILNAFSCRLRAEYASKWPYDVKILWNISLLIEISAYFSHITVMDVCNICSLLFDINSHVVTNANVNALASDYEAYEASLLSLLRSHCLRHWKSSGMLHFYIH